MVLLHVSLPDSAGVETFERIHRAAPGTPTLVISGSVDEPVITRCTELGAQDFYLNNEPESLIAEAVYNTATRLAKEQELS